MEERGRNDRQRSIDDYDISDNHGCEDEDQVRNTEAYNN